MTLFCWALTEADFLRLGREGWIPVGIHPCFRGRSVLMRKG